MKNSNNNLSNEDMIKDISGKINEIESYCNVLYSAITNEYDSVDNSDIKNSLILLIDYVKTLKKDTENYISSCEENGIFSISDKGILKA